MAKGTSHFVRLLCAIQDINYFVWAHSKKGRIQELRRRREAVEGITELKTEGLIEAMGMTDFLTFWNVEVVKRIGKARFPQDEIQRRILDRGSIFLEPASRTQMDKLESRLGLSLSPTLLQFLSNTNGVMTTIDIGLCNYDFYPVEEIGWLHEKDPELVEIWTKELSEPSDEEYFQYGEEQDPQAIRSEYLKRMIALGPVVDGGVYLLNPQVMFSNGEFEAWSFSPKLPGAIRHRSFANLLEAHCRGSCRDLDYWSVSYEHEQREI